MCLCFSFLHNYCLFSPATCLVRCTCIAYIYVLVFLSFTIIVHLFLQLAWFNVYALLPFGSLFFFSLQILSASSCNLMFEFWMCYIELLIKMVYIELRDFLSWTFYIFSSVDVTVVLCDLELTIKRVKVSTAPDGRVMDLFFVTDTRFVIMVVFSLRMMLHFCFSFVLYLPLHFCFHLHFNFHFAILKCLFSPSLMSWDFFCMWLLL